MQESQYVEDIIQLCRKSVCCRYHWIMKESQYVGDTIMQKSQPVSGVIGFCRKTQACYCVKNIRNSYTYNAPFSSNGMEAVLYHTQLILRRKISESRNVEQRSYLE
ncbi:hypothetical protein CDAR_597971 [Caerostris darwini]|uniref:Uncharacterized protein n=1 Tax=Caerostris darwini TaxID=1538125 RepID=A0AAV4MF33_9ARAC|nr:hypothetical protein CDAR_597971 [Caerostris darwini]